MTSEEFYNTYVAMVTVELERANLRRPLQNKSVFYHVTRSYAFWLAKEMHETYDLKDYAESIMAGNLPRCVTHEHVMDFLEDIWDGFEQEGLVEVLQDFRNHIVEYFGN